MFNWRCTYTYSVQGVTGFMKFHAKVEEISFRDNFDIGIY